MEMLPSKSISDISFFWIILLLFILLLLLGMQGFDVVDEGWYLSYYQQFFSHPETVEYNFVFYFTGLIGGLWYQLFPEGGIFSFRILASLILIACTTISFKILKPYISNTIALIGLIMVMFVEEFGYISFYYNHLSALMALATIYFLFRGTKENRIIYLLIAGVLTAINIYVRLPNFTLLALVLCIPVMHGWPKNKDKSKVLLNQLIFYGLGFILGFFLSYLIVLSLGHDSIVKNALEGIFIKGQSEGSNHNILALFKVYIKNYILVFKQMGKLLILFVALILLNRNLKNRFLQFFGYSVGLVAFIYVFSNKTIYAVYAFGFMLSLAYLFWEKSKNRHYSGLLFLAVALMILMPLGSDGGINNVGYMSIWLIFPLSLYGLKTFHFPKSIVKAEVKSPYKIQVVIILVAGYALTRIYSISNNAYFDPGARIDKVYAVESPLASGIYTTQNRAAIINEVIETLNLVVKEDDYLLAYDKIPMLNYLTKTKPYMYNSWVWVYDGAMFEQQLKRARNEIDVLPVIVQQKFETIDAFSAPVLDYMSEEKQDNYYYNRNRVIAMNNFMEKNNYQIVWSNAYFNIYTTAKVSSGN